MNITATKNIPRIQMILQMILQKDKDKKTLMSQTQSPQIRIESKIGVGFYEDFEHVTSLVNYDAIVLIDGNSFRPSYPVQKL
jgi:hypothetical protein